jgi:glycerol-3-phosphate acyltransferase PlsY
MPPTTTALAAILAAAFLAGSIPFGLLIARSRGIDIRKHGSGNIGATNVGRVLGKPYFAICFTLDLLKGLLPTLAMGLVLGALGRFTFSLDIAAWWLGAAVASILGHVFCPWLGFKGGKGVATGLGALLGVFPLLSVAAAVATLTWLLTMYLSRYVSLASIVASLTLAPTIAIAWAVSQPSTAIVSDTAARSGRPLLIGVGALLSILVVWTHRANIRRLRAGTELRATGTKQA